MEQREPYALKAKLDSKTIICPSVKQLYALCSFLKKNKLSVWLDIVRSVYNWRDDAHFIQLWPAEVSMFAGRASTMADLTQ